MLCFLSSAVFTAENQTATPAKKRPAPAFVSVKDKNFLLGDEPYHLIGTNMWYAPQIGSPSARAGSRIRLLREIKNLKALGVTNVRLLGISEESTVDNAVAASLVKSNGELNEDMLRGLDFTMSVLYQHKIKAVIYLGNFWEWSGGMSSYVSWSKSGDQKNIPDPDSPEFAAYAAQFYSDEKAIEKYNGVIKQILNRKNRVTRRLYKEDPFIMAWELSNAPRPGLDNKNLPAYYEWIKNTTALIKSIDKNHLVTLGSEGTIGCLDMEECVINAHKDTGVDYMTFHLRPIDWGWMDINAPEKTYDAATKKAADYIEQHIKLADKLDMPLVLEDFAFSRDAGKYGRRTRVDYRNQFYTFVYSKVEESMKNQRALVGSNFWSWGGVGQAEHGDGKWRDGDYLYTGDTPREPQGVNSVFDSDAATLRVIRRHQRSITSVDDKETVAQNKATQ